MSKLKLLSLSVLAAVLISTLTSCGEYYIEPEHYGIYVGDIAVSLENHSNIFNDETASVEYNNSNKTLYLNNAIIDADNASDGISSIQDITIDLTGKNIIILNSQTSISGIYSFGNLTVKGTGSLEIIIDGLNACDAIYGIHSDAAVSICTPISIQLSNAESAYGISCESINFSNNSLDISVNNCVNIESLSSNDTYLYGAIAAIRVDNATEAYGFRGPTELIQSKINININECDQGFGLYSDTPTITLKTSDAKVNFENTSTVSGIYNGEGALSIDHSNVTISANGAHDAKGIVSKNKISATDSNITCFKKANADEQTGIYTDTLNLLGNSFLLSSGTTSAIVYSNLRIYSSLKSYGLTNNKFSLISDLSKVNNYGTICISKNEPSVDLLTEDPTEPDNKEDNNQYGSPDESVTEPDTEEVHTHSYEVITVSSTCINKGEKIVKCACGDVKSRVDLPLSGHKPSAKVAGKDTVCTVCNKVLEKGIMPTTGNNLSAATVYANALTNTRNLDSYTSDFLMSMKSFGLGVEYKGLLTTEDEETKGTATQKISLKKAISYDYSYSDDDGFSVWTANGKSTQYYPFDFANLGEGIVADFSSSATSKFKFKDNAKTTLTLSLTDKEVWDSYENIINYMIEVTELNIEGMTVGELTFTSADLTVIIKNNIISEYTLKLKGENDNVKVTIEMNTKIEEK